MALILAETAKIGEIKKQPDIECDEIVNILPFTNQHEDSGD